jgi:hypothetical protein
MPKYLTPLQFRAADTGVLTADVTDFVLADKIQNAETDIDAFCGFTLQAGGFEQHRAWMQQAWDEDSLRTRVPNWPVPVQAVYGYKIQVSNLSGAGAGFFATINSGDVSINTYEGYVEIVPLQAVTYSLSPVLLQLGLKPPIVQFEYQAGFLFPVFGEILYNKGDNQTYYASRGFWAMTNNQALSIQPLQLQPIPPVVYVNGVSQSSSLYTLNSTDGIVTFNSPQSASAIVTLDYTYTIPDNVKQAAIARTTWILGQRQLNRMGMSGLDYIQGDREQRVRRFQHTSEQLDGLIDPDTASKLLGYKTIAVG